MLYILAAQPLAARLRQLQAAGRIDGIQLPDGSLAPPCHQHADDTSIHTATVQAAAVAHTEAVVPFAASSNALLSVRITYLLSALACCLDLKLPPLQLAQNPTLVWLLYSRRTLCAT
jgi:hypothetical protein